MGEYLQGIYEQRKERAESYRQQLIELQSTILRRSDEHRTGVNNYSNEERVTHRNDLQKILKRLTLEIDSILEIEADLK